MLIEELVMLSYIGSMPADKPRVDDVELIEDLLVTANGLQDFAQGLCDVAAQVASRETGIAVDCGISLSRPKRPSAVAGSTAIAAQLMDGEHDTVDDGPCLKPGQRDRASWWGPMRWSNAGRCTARPWPWPATQVHYLSLSPSGTGPAL
ncbi:hypothetical protein AAHB34_09730 [Paenarthrobacter ureafaciens]